MEGGKGTQKGQYLQRDQRRHLRTLGGKRIKDQRRSEMGIENKVEVGLGGRGQKLGKWNFCKGEEETGRKRILEWVNRQPTTSPRRPPSPLSNPT